MDCKAWNILRYFVFGLLQRHEFIALAVFLIYHRVSGLWVRFLRPLHHISPTICFYCTKNDSVDRHSGHKAKNTSGSYTLQYHIGNRCYRHRFTNLPRPAGAAGSRISDEEHIQKETWE